jgi:hypothetical protein
LNPPLSVGAGLLLAHGAAVPTPAPGVVPGRTVLGAIESTGARNGWLLACVLGGGSVASGSLPYLNKDPNGKC